MLCVRRRRRKSAAVRSAVSRELRSWNRARRLGYLGDLGYQGTQLAVAGNESYGKKSRERDLRQHAKRPTVAGKETYRSRERDLQ